MSVVTHKLLQILKEEAQAIQAVQKLLTKEQELLIQAAIEDLLAIAEQKGQAVTGVNTISQKRYSFLEAEGHSANERGMQEWLATNTNRDVTRAWEQLRDITAEAKETNRVNGLLISKHLSRNSHALQLLRRNAQDAGTYGPDGHTKAGTLGRGITA